MTVTSASAGVMLLCLTMLQYSEFKLYTMCQNMGQEYFWELQLQTTLFFATRYKTNKQKTNSMV
jgi:hypothetical protein